MRHMKRRAKLQPALKHEILSILDQLNVALEETTNLWKIRFANDQTPMVIAKTDLKPVYKRILTNKIEGEQLHFLRSRI